jgi:ferredoxin-NADP reductase
VASRIDRGGDVLEITLVPIDGGVVPAFLPGQHVEFTLKDRGLTRFYSLVSPGGYVAETLSIAVRRARSQARGLSAHLHDHMAIGDIFLLAQPAGCFVLPVASSRPLVCVAGGVGITPFVSYLRSLATSIDRPPNVALHLVCRSAIDIPFRDEIEALARLVPEVTIQRHLSSAGPRIETVFSVDPLTRPLVYLCGPAGLMNTITTRLVSLGTPPSDIQREAFTAAAGQPTVLPTATIRLARSGRCFEWTVSDSSILEAAGRSGVALPSGCRVGQCESCALPLLAGKIHMAGPNINPDACLTCCSVPQGDITLDA